MPPRETVTVTTDPTQPPRLLIRPDGMVEIPLRGTMDPQTKTLTPRDPVILPEPNMAQLAIIQDLVADADKVVDDEVGKVPEIPNTTVAKIAAGVTLDADEQQVWDDRREIMRNRTRYAYSEKGPWGEALIKVIELLTGATYTRNDLPGWAGHWAVISQIYGHFMDPFAGRVGAQPDGAVTTEVL